MHPPFPFSAIVGQETLRRALVLGLIQPSLGGVLVRGTKGVAKSTAVRALAGLLPAVETVAGCPFQRRPGEAIPAWPLPADAPVERRPVPLVELPLGATEDRVLGSLHLGRALRGERAFEPGLLAAANRGILYIDEVNLLPDHLVDVLLDAAAGGTHRLEREGLSVNHPARFLLVGTMNPEEGDLRPQLLDRFGLVVDVADLTDPRDRAEAVRRRLAYEADPVAFSAAWREADAAEAARIAKAQELLPRVCVPAQVLDAVVRLCLEAGAEGLRADLSVCKAACAWAAYHGRTEVDVADADAVAELALAHRRTRPPQPPGGGRPTGPDRDNNQGQDDGHASTAQRLPSGAQVQQSAGAFTTPMRPPAELLSRSTESGRWRAAARPEHGRPSSALRAYRPGCLLSGAGTLRACATRSPRLPLYVQGEDLRGWPRRGPGGCLLLFVLDASGSMAAWQRMRQTKSAVLSLLVQAYRQRDRVALLAFHGGGAELVLPPARGLARARAALERLPAGGSTPLAEGLAAAGRLIRAEQRRRPRQPVWLVLLTDGRANAAAAGAPWQAALDEARVLGKCVKDVLVVDTETGHRLGRAAEVARALGASCVQLEDVLGRPPRAAV